MSDAPQRQPIDSRSGFHAALREAFDELARTGCREIWLVDEDFADWPLNEPAVIEALSRWAISHRRCTVLARQFDVIARRHPRWVEWRRTYAHVVQCRSNDELQPGEMPTMLLAPGLASVRLFDPLRHRGALSRDPSDAVVWRDAIDALLQRSQEAFPATTLGL